MRDVTEAEHLKKITQEISEKYSQIDICIANAGYSVYGLFEKTTSAQWRRKMEINFFGVIWTTQAACLFLKKAKDASSSFRAWLAS